jgi:hypothetical protein
MSEPFVYRSHAAKVVDAWKAAQDGLHEYVRATDDVLERAGLGDYQVYRGNHRWHPWSFAGLAIPEGEKPPKGWRMNAEYAVPDKRTKAGKEIAAALAAVKHPGAPFHKVPGMPNDVCYPGGFTSPGARLLEDGNALYVSWRIDPAGCRESFSSPTTEIDDALWHRVPLSEYYAEVERAEAAAAVTA